MTNPVVELRKIQGPFRHTWWCFWVEVHRWFFTRLFLGYGPWSPSWVFGNAALRLARLERLTR